MDRLPAGQVHRPANRAHPPVGRARRSASRVRHSAGPVRPSVNRVHPSAGLILRSADRVPPSVSRALRFLSPDRLPRCLPVRPSTPAGRSRRRRPVHRRARPRQRPFAGSSRARAVVRNDPTRSQRGVYRSRLTLPGRVSAAESVGKAPPNLHQLLRAPESNRGRRGDHCPIAWRCVETRRHRGRAAPVWRIRRPA